MQSSISGFFPRKLMKQLFLHGRSSDLLRFLNRLPKCFFAQWQKKYSKTLKELTAAGLFGIFTRFPFNFFLE